MSNPSSTMPAKPKPPRRVGMGIVGIERSIDLQSKTREKNISEAFQDINSLVNMAKPMVKIAQDISEKIKKQDGISEDETVEFRQHLLSLGISNPVTKSKYKSSGKFYESLAKELCSVLESAVEKSGGMMSLVEAFCRLNRARGVDVASANDLMNACQCLAKLNLPLRLREFDSEVSVLQHVSFDDDYCVTLTISLLDKYSYLTPEEYSRTANVPFLLAKHSLSISEKRGKICRDNSIEGLRFYPNLFLDYKQG